MKEVSVIYVEGAARSSSTFLDTVLGNNAQIVSLGELSNALGAWSNVDEYCACGTIAQNCEFWKHVRQEWVPSTHNLPKKEEWTELRNSFELIRSLRDTIRQGRDRPNVFISI